MVIKSCLKGAEKKELKVPIVNLETLQEKSAYSRFNFGKISENNEKSKVRSASLNKNDNRLVKEAISAARGLIETEDPKPKNPVKNVGNGNKTAKKIKEPVKVSRPTTAPQKRAPSPKSTDAKNKAFNPSKVASFGNIKKKIKPNL